MTIFEEKLAKKFNKKYCCFTGNATTAIYLILKSMFDKKEKILFPAITCTAPINAALYSGHDVIFSDINLENYTFEKSDFKKKIEKYDVKAVVLTHIYGNRCDDNCIKDICKKKNILLIEDAAQSYYFGEYDVSVMSFGHSKILEAGFGGAIFTDRKDIYDRILEEKLCINKIRKERIDEIFSNYRIEYYNVKEYSIFKHEFYEKILKLQKKYMEKFIFLTEENYKILDVIENLEENIKKRSEKKYLYQKMLTEKNIIKPKLSEKEGLWRYSFLYNGDKELLLREVRRKGIDISDWYMNMSNIYSNKNKLKNADVVENKIVNLWLDEKHSIEKINEDIKLINRIIEGAC